MSKKEKILLKASIVFAAVFAIVPAANAMHIMEGYLPAKYCVAWGVVCLPFLMGKTPQLPALSRDKPKSGAPL